jgi:hypothetical protein
MKTCLVVSVVLFSVIGLISLPVQADTVDDLMKSAADNYKAQKYMKALEDLDWAKQEISNLHIQIVKKLLPESMSGYQIREVDGAAMFGMHSVSREYFTDDKDIKITIAGGKAGQGGSGLSALMGMASKFQSMDAGTESSMVVVHGRKGRFNLETVNNSGNLTFELNNDVYVSVETNGFTSSVEAKKAAEKLDFDAIEKAFQ